MKQNYTMDQDGNLVDEHGAIKVPADQVKKIGVAMLGLGAVMSFGLGCLTGSIFSD